MTLTVGIKCEVCGDTPVRCFCDACLRSQGENNGPMTDKELRGRLDDVGFDRSPPESAKDYVTRAIASFDGDPPDNQFQKGYLAALEVVRDEAFPSTESSQP